MCQGSNLVDKCSTTEHTHTLILFVLTLFISLFYSYGMMNSCTHSINIPFWAMEFSLRIKSARKFGRMKSTFGFWAQNCVKVIVAFSRDCEQPLWGWTGLLEKALGRFPGSCGSLGASVKRKTRARCGELISAYLTHLVVHIELYSLTTLQWCL